MRLNRLESKKILTKANQHFSKHKTSYLVVLACSSGIGIANTFGTGHHVLFAFSWFWWITTLRIATTTDIERNNRDDK